MKCINFTNSYYSHQIYINNMMLILITQLPRLIHIHDKGVPIDILT